MLAVHTCPEPPLAGQKTLSVAGRAWNGPWTLDDDLSLEAWDATLVESARGKRRFLSGVGTSDAHDPGQTVGLPHTVVHAEDLGQVALVEGIRLGRSWLAESAGVSLELIVENGGRRAGLGERLSVRDDASVNITAAVGGAPETCVRILTDQGQMIRQGLDAGGAVRWLTTPGQAAYVRAEVRRTADIGVRGLPYGSMVAMTNPVFLGRMPSAGSSASTVSTAPPLRRNSSSTCERGRCRPRHRSGRPARSRSTRRPGRPGVLPHRRQNRRGPGHRQPERHAGRLAHQHRPGHHSLHRPAGHCPGPAGPSPPRGEVAR